MELSGPYLAACALLVVAGLSKARRPHDTARALVRARTGAHVDQPGPRTSQEQRAAFAVRLGALGEALLGLAALLYFTPALSAAVAASYTGFLAFVLVARRRGGPLSTCGCFGQLDTPPTRLHVLLDAGLATAAIWTAVDGTTGWTPHWLGAQPWHGVPLLLLAATLAWSAALCMTGAARLVAARGLVAGAGAQRGGAG